MFYEGSEKRLEITCTLNLLDFEDRFWQEMVKQAGALILSDINNGQLKGISRIKRIITVVDIYRSAVDAALPYQNR